jgi:transposase-like protein
MLFEIAKRTPAHLHPTNDSWRVDQTYIQVKAGWKYLYRAIDCAGNTIRHLRKILNPVYGWLLPGIC